MIEVRKKIALFLLLLIHIFLIPFFFHPFPFVRITNSDQYGFPPPLFPCITIVFVYLIFPHHLLLSWFFHHWLFPVLLNIYHLDDFFLKTGDFLLLASIFKKFFILVLQRDCDHYFIEINTQYRRFQKETPQICLKKNTPGNKIPKKKILTFTFLNQKRFNFGVLFSETLGLEGYFLRRPVLHSQLVTKPMIISGDGSFAFVIPVWLPNQFLIWWV